MKNRVRINTTVFVTSRNNKFAALRSNPYRVDFPVVAAIFRCSRRRTFRSDEEQPRDRPVIEVVE